MLTRQTPVSVHMCVRVCDGAVLKIIHRRVTAARKAQIYNDPSLEFGEQRLHMSHPSNPNWIDRLYQPSHAALNLCESSLTYNQSKATAW